MEGFFQPESNSKDSSTFTSVITPLHADEKLSWILHIPPQN